MKMLKTILSIGGLLFIGFISGFYVHRVVAIKKIEAIRALDRVPAIERQFFESIHASPEQRAVLEPIIAEHGAKMVDFLKESREKRRQLMMDLHHDVKPHLSKEQILQLKKFVGRFFHEKSSKKKPARRKQMQE
ncbi:MAG: hypothetical protein DHS20C18_07060 [Saprospiraceae bacterium]|nr:MAG: hypothetical protein DHS20C18_07060 [Saprospiraceae bacterium]